MKTTLRHLTTLLTGLCLLVALSTSSNAIESDKLEKGLEYAQLKLPRGYRAADWQDFTTKLKNAAPEIVTGPDEDAIQAIRKSLPAGETVSPEILSSLAICAHVAKTKNIHPANQSIIKGIWPFSWFF